MRLLLVEDETALAVLITARLRAASFLVDMAHEIGDAAIYLEMTEYDLVILDRRLPDGDGVTLIPTIRKLRPGATVLVLTALDAVPDRVTGLDAGADDYMPKPFDMDELLARVRAGLRRRGGTTPQAFTCGRVSFDADQRQVTIGDEPLVLQRRELALFELLIQRAGKVVQRETIDTRLYGIDDDIQSNALDVQISRLRKRLQSMDAGVAIHTVRGVGYVMKQA